MRKICFSVVVLSMILLMISFSFAQTPREGTPSEGKTSFANVAVRGVDNDGSSAFQEPGSPGYIEMTSTSGQVYYLYVSYEGVLCIASDESVGYVTSPATVHWGGHQASGVAVGNQN